MEHKGYYAIIPANVRYDKSLTPNAKLLYGEITALCNERGFCWASNEYFAKLYGVSKTSITKWINSLVDNGYVLRVMRYKEGSKEIEGRCLTTVNDPLNKSWVAPLTKVNDPTQQKLRDNNTINNTINREGDKPPHSPKFTPPTIEEVAEYCKKRKNNINPQNFVSFYESKGWMIGKNKMKNWKQAVITWEGREPKGETRRYKKLD